MFSNRPKSYLRKKSALLQDYITIGLVIGSFYIIGKLYNKKINPSVDPKEQNKKRI